MGNFVSSGPFAPSTLDFEHLSNTIRVREELYVVLKTVQHVLENHGDEPEIRAIWALYLPRHFSEDNQFYHGTRQFAGFLEKMVKNLEWDIQNYSVPSNNPPLCLRDKNVVTVRFADNNIEASSCGVQDNLQPGATRPPFHGPYATASGRCIMVAPRLSHQQVLLFHEKDFRLVAGHTIEEAFATQTTVMLHEMTHAILNTVDARLSSENENRYCDVETRRTATRDAVSKLIIAYGFKLCRILALGNDKQSDSQRADVSADNLTFVIISIYMTVMYLNVDFASPSGWVKLKETVPTWIEGWWAKHHKLHADWAAGVGRPPCSILLADIDGSHAPIRRQYA